jgi:hypothetical protein
MIDLYIDPIDTSSNSQDCVDLTDADERVRELSRQLIESRAEYESNVKSVKEENHTLKSTLSEMCSTQRQTKAELLSAQNLARMHSKTIQALEHDIVSLNKQQKELVAQSDQLRKDSFVAGFINVRPPQPSYFVPIRIIFLHSSAFPSFLLLYSSAISICVLVNPSPPFMNLRRNEP